MALTDNLVSYWSLDEASGNAVDAHGDNDLTDSGGVGTTAGKVGTARDFEQDSSQRLTIADNADLSMGDIDFTLTGWFRLESKSADMTILGKWTASGNHREYLLYYSSSANRLRFSVTPSGSVTGRTDVDADALGSPSTDTWYFVVVDHDATANVIGIQVNNGTRNTASYSAGVYNGTSAFGLGLNTAGISTFDGAADEVGVWKRVLTSDEKTTLYNGGNGLAYPFPSFNPAFARGSNQILQAR